MKINSIFLTIEGEGIEIGIPKIFIRFQGCSMGCVNCDTPEAINPNKGKEMSVKDILSNVKNLNIKNVTITGGNPLEQNLEELLNLVKELKKINYYISIEVTGCDNIKNGLDKIFNNINFISFDMKSPSSKCKEEFHKSSIGWSHKSQYKIIVKTEKDYIYAKSMIKKYRMCNIVLTPCWNVNDKINKEAVQWLYKNVLKDNLNTRVIVQQHKIVYGADKQNV